LWWMCQLLLWSMHPWPYRDGASLGIVEGGPRQGGPTVVAKAVVLTFPLPLPLPLPLALPLAFATVVGVGVGGGGAA
jgi:hypothetical protein